MFKSRDELRKLQLEHLQTLLPALAANPFYKNKVHPVGSLEDFFSLPFTKKEEVVQDQLKDPPYGTNLTYPLDSYTRFHQTSGTSGAPLRWLDTNESWAWMVQNWCEVFKAAGVNPSDRILFAFSFGPFIGFWLAYEAAQRIGSLAIPAGGTSSYGRLKLLMENQVTVICCTPTYAAHLAEIAAQHSIDLKQSSVRLIMVAGEIGGSVPATRQNLEKLWAGARVFDHHGMTEIGPVTFECPLNPGCLHVNESAYIPEIIDPATSSPQPPGEIGELVLTNLGRVGSPLIRYKTGDLVRARSSGQCSCGRFDLLLEGGILSRVDDMIIIRGVNVYPSAIEDIVREFPEIKEYQVTVDRRKTLPELRIALETARDCRTDLSARLQEVLQLRIPVDIVPELPRYEMKAKRWLFLT